jgi:hypothetical protein
MRIKHKKLAVLVSTVAILALAGAAFAYWTQGGIGNGSATAGSTSPITVYQTSVITGLYPGATPTALSGNFKNTNTGPVTISSITATVRAFTSHLVDAAKPDCTEADFAIGGSSGSNVVPVGDPIGSWSGLTVGLVAGAGNQDNCKGVAITIDYVAHA